MFADFAVPPSDESCAVAAAAAVGFAAAADAVGRVVAAVELALGHGVAVDLVAPVAVVEW